MSWCLFRVNCVANSCTQIVPSYTSTTNLRTPCVIAENSFVTSAMAAKFHKGSHARQMPNYDHKKSYWKNCPEYRLFKSILPHPSTNRFENCYFNFQPLAFPTKNLQTLVCTVKMTLRSTTKAFLTILLSGLNISGAIHPSVPIAPVWHVTEFLPCASFLQSPKSDIMALSSPLALRLEIKTLWGLMSRWTETKIQKD